MNNETKELIRWMLNHSAWYLVKATNCKGREGFKLMSEKHSPVRFYKKHVVERIEYFLKKKRVRLILSRSAIRAVDGRKPEKKIYKKSLHKSKPVCEKCYFPTGLLKAKNANH